MATKQEVSMQDLDTQFQALAERAQILAEGLTDTQMTWSPEENRWSIAHCLDHLNIVGEGYLEAIDESLAQARSQGRTGDGISRPGFLERWFVSRMEPPPKGKMKAPKSMLPTLSQPPAKIVERFLAMHRRYRDAATAGAELDVNRATLRSPFLRLLKLRVGAALEMTAAHERRHLWQAENVRKSQGFPG